MSIYQSIYNLIQTYIFGGLELTATQTLVTELYSLGACLFMISIPFLFILFIVIMLFKLMRW